MKLPMKATSGCLIVGRKEKEYDKNKFSYSLAIVCDGEVANVSCDKGVYVEAESLQGKLATIFGEFDTTYKNFKVLMLREDSKAVKGA